MALSEYERLTLEEIEAHLATVRSTSWAERRLVRVGLTVVGVVALLAVAVLCCTMAGVGMIAVFAAGWNLGGLGVPAGAALVVVWLSMAGVFAPRRTASGR